MYAGCKCECPNCGERCTVPYTRQTARFKTNETRENGADFDYGNFAWRRFMARFVDGVLGSLLVFLLVFVCVAADIGTSFIEWLWAPEHKIAAQVLETLFVFFSGSLVYSMFGNTLGKKLFGIRVCDENGNRLSGLGYFIRDIRVLVSAYWFNVPVLKLIAMVMQYRLVKNGASASHDRDEAYQARPTRGKRSGDVPIFIVAVIIRISLNILALE